MTCESSDESASSNPPADDLGNASIGRYRILSRLGEGGMGVVYAAHDPELDRKVAVKLLRQRPSDGADRQARLLREAQAMARLSHPNVVSVHDVGRFEDQVFIAMEFIDGRTLGKWLQEKPRSWREVLAVFRQAGKGLAAAHSAGLVHRDFKPTNVLVAKDGSVKVTDFGVAFASSGGSDQSNVAIAGTPGYMAPEQRRGEQLDARADQYSYCVALHEALTGERPTESSLCSYKTLTNGRPKGATQTGTQDEFEQSGDKEMIQVPTGARLPRWALRAVLRGLSPDRSDRFENLDALLKALEEPVRPWKRVAAVLAVAAVVLSCILTYRITVYRHSLACKGATDRISAIWGPTRQEAIRRAFLSTAKPYAADAFSGVRLTLDALSRAWVAMHIEACQATRLRAEQSEALLDLRMGCLQDRLEEMRALTDLFAHADAQIVEKSVQATEAITPLSGCADTAALTAQVNPPPEIALGAQVEKQRKALAEIKALKDTGKYARGLEMARMLVTASREINYKPLEAKALLLLGELLEATIQPKEAEEVLHLAAIVADAVRHDPDRARALISWANVVGFRDGRIEEGLGRARDASAVVERLGNPPQLDSMLQQTLGSILLRQGKHKEALQHLSHALDVKQRALGAENSGLVSTLTLLGNALREAGEYEQSVSYTRKALEMSERLFGPEHPFSAIALGNLGITLRWQGKYVDALAAEQRALAIFERALGSQNLRLAPPLVNLASTLRDQGQYKEALPLLKRAILIHEKAQGVNHPDLIVPLVILGNVNRYMGNLEASFPYYRRALAIVARALGPEHEKVAFVWTNLAGALSDQGDFVSALEHLRNALRIQEKALGAHDIKLSATLLQLGLTLHRYNKRENFEIAVGYLNRALALKERAFGPESPGVALVLAPLGLIESEREPAKGLAHLQRALSIQEKILPADSPLIGSTLLQMGEAYLNLRQPLEAKLRLERALRLLESNKGAPTDLAWTRFLLARALWIANSDRVRAIELAQQARTTFKAGEHTYENLRRVNTWLSARARPTSAASLAATKRASD